MLKQFLSLNFILTCDVSEVIRRKTKSLDLKNTKENLNSLTLDLGLVKKKSSKDKDLPDNVLSVNSSPESKRSFSSFKLKPKVKYLYDYEQSPSFEFNRSMKYKLIVEIKDKKTDRRYFMNPENLIKMMLNQETGNTSESELMNMKQEDEEKNVMNKKLADDLIYTLKICQSQIIKLICQANKFKLPDELEENDSEIFTDKKKILECYRDVRKMLLEDNLRLKSEIDQLKSKKVCSVSIDVVKSQRASRAFDIYKMLEDTIFEGEESSTVTQDEYLTTFEHSGKNPVKITVKASVNTDPRDDNTSIFGKINVVSTGCDEFDFALSLLHDERARFKRNRITVEPELFFLLDNIVESQQKKPENSSIRFKEHPDCKFSALTAMLQPFLDNIDYFSKNKLNREIFSKILNIKDVESFIDSLLIIYFSEQHICDEIDRLSCSTIYNQKSSLKQAYRIFKKLIKLAQLKKILLDSLRNKEIDIKKMVKESKKYIFESNRGVKPIDIKKYTQFNLEQAQYIKREHLNMTTELKNFFKTKKIREKKDDVTREVLQEHIFWVYSTIFDLTTVSAIPSAEI
ncbi:hypothetical protein M153_2770006929 [Pseudoloma neurophilia]|uniref:Uncharacterized protein n=1 Tax=Pseudoloma neurophilia TaxID=146866 RepID=A0A0R0M5Q2_9MICR|nr:hypothetical protein M153_2770006929 [Pseudoloma neurophilia]